LASSTQYHCMSKCSSVSNILSPSEEFWWKHKNISYCGSVFSIATYYPIYVGRIIVCPNAVLSVTFYLPVKSFDESTRIFPTVVPFLV